MCDMEEREGKKEKEKENAEWKFQMLANKM